MDVRTIIKSSAVFGIIAVAFGAFGAHKLKELISPESLANWETGIRYMFYHTMSLFLIGVLCVNNPVKELTKAAQFFIIGIILFSGSLFGLSLRSLISLNLLWLGPITPIGGLAFIIGWIYLFLAARKIKIN